MENIRNSLEPTILIMIFSILISVVVGIPVGVISAVHRNSILDYLLMTVSVFGLSIPVFWSGIMLAYYIGAVKGWLPAMYYVPIATGGLAKFITPLCRHKIVVDDALLLKGLLILYRKNTEVH